MGTSFDISVKCFRNCSCIHLNLKLCKDWNQLQPYFFYPCCAGFTRFSPHKQLSTFWIPLRCYTSTPTSGIFHSLISSCEYIMVCNWLWSMVDLQLLYFVLVNILYGMYSIKSYIHIFFTRTKFFSKLYQIMNFHLFINYRTFFLWSILICVHKK